MTESPLKIFMEALKTKVEKRRNDYTRKLNSSLYELTEAHFQGARDEDDWFLLLLEGERK